MWANIGLLLKYDIDVTILIDHIVTVKLLRSLVVNRKSFNFNYYNVEHYRFHLLFNLLGLQEKYYQTKLLEDPLNHVILFIHEMELIINKRY